MGLAILGLCWCRASVYGNTELREKKYTRAACRPSEPRLSTTLEEGKIIYPATAQGRELLGVWYYILPSSLVGAELSCQMQFQPCS